MRYIVRYGENQGTSDTGTKRECLGWAQMRSERNPDFLVHVVERVPTPKLFGQVRATFKAGVRIV